MQIIWVIIIIPGNILSPHHGHGIYLKLYLIYHGTLLIFVDTLEICFMVSKNDFRYPAIV
jgi:hypothetical protein